MSLLFAFLYYLYQTNPVLWAMVCKWNKWSFLHCTPIILSTLWYADNSWQAMLRNQWLKHQLGYQVWWPIGVLKYWSTIIRIKPDSSYISISGIIRSSPLRKISSSFESPDTKNQQILWTTFSEFLFSKVTIYGIIIKNVSEVASSRKLINIGVKMVSGLLSMLVHTCHRTWYLDVSFCY